MYTYRPVKNLVRVLETASFASLSTLVPLDIPLQLSVGRGNSLPRQPERAVFIFPPTTGARRVMGLVNGPEVAFDFLLPA